MQVKWVAVGDSITKGTAADVTRRMTKRFGPGYVDAVGGRGPYTPSKKFPDQPGTSMDAVKRAVEALGGDGVLVIEEDGRFVTQEDYRRFVSEVVATTPPTVRLVWVMPIDTDAEYADHVAGHRRSIRAELPAHPNSARARWAKHVRQHPEFTPDGRHPDCKRTKACRVYARLVERAALGSHPGPA